MLMAARYSRTRGDARKFSVMSLDFIRIITVFFSGLQKRFTELDCCCTENHMWCWDLWILKSIIGLGPECMISGRDP
jgi:hypothetical protein